MSKSGLLELLRFAVEFTGSSPMLDIGLPFRVRGRQKDAGLSLDERLQVGRNLGAPAPRLFLVGVGAP